jgi:hypothetical protein
MLMSRGFRLTLQLVATLAAAAAVARVTESAVRAFSQAAVGPPRHRALTTGAVAMSSPAPAPQHAAASDQIGKTPAAPHPFGPAAAVPCRSIDLSPTRSNPTTSATDAIELEASGELDDEESPTERLLARRHAPEFAS